MTKRVKIILAHLVFLIVVIYLFDSDVIIVQDSTGLIMLCVYLSFIIGLIIYNFVKKKNYEAKSHLIFLVIFLMLIVILFLLVISGAGMPAMRY